MCVLAATVGRNKVGTILGDTWQLGAGAGLCQCDDGAMASTSAKAVPWRPTRVQQGCYGSAMQIYGSQILGSASQPWRIQSSTAIGSIVDESTGLARSLI